MIQIYLRSLRCDGETDEAGADEPYVLVAAADLSARVTVQGFAVPLPAFEVVRYGPFEDFDAGETFTLQPPTSLFAIQSQAFWGLSGKGAPLADPNGAIFVVGLMENDDGSPEALRSVVKAVMGASLLGSLSLDRTQKVAKLVQDMTDALVTPTGGPSVDERIGFAQELQFSAGELAQAEAGGVASKALVFAGDGGQYTLTFEASKVPDPVIPNRVPPGGGRGGTRCFTGDTLVLLADHTFRRIEDVRVGDMVVAEDEFGDERAACEVTGVHAHPAEEALRLTFGPGRFVDTTPEHRFRLHSGDFVPAGRLRAGTRLRSLAATDVTVESVTSLTAAGQVYNLTVGRLHTYFVTQDRILVHNAKQRDPDG